MNYLPEAEKTRKRLIKSLKENGYKLTSQRLEIINLLSKESTHPNAMHIFKKAQKKAPQLSISTVYYTLDILKKEGLIRELEFYDQDNRYEVNISNHLNLICTTCCKIEDFMQELPFSSHAVEKKTGFQPVRMRFEYYGCCKACRRKQNK